MNQPLSNNSCFVIGIDVGGPKKGFHAFALRDGRYEAKFTSLNASSVVDWCMKIDARAIGIDAPCRWRSTGRARTTERTLAKAGISTFATPSRGVYRVRSLRPVAETAS